MQQPEPLRPKLFRQPRDPRDVTARPGQAGNETLAYGVTADGEHDWDCRGRGLYRERCLRAARRGDYGHLAADQIGRQFRQPLGSIVRPTKFDGNVLALDVAGFAQSFAKSGHSLDARLWRTAIEIPHHRHRRLLRARRERPRGCRTTEKRDELPPSKMIESHGASPVRGPHRILPKMAYRGQRGSVTYFAVSGRPMEWPVLMLWTAPSTGTRVPWMWVLLKAPRFEGANHANDHHDRSRHRQIGFSGPRC